VRVLQLNARYQGGGAERCSRELFEYLPRAGVATDLWICEHDRTAPPAVRTLPLFWERTCLRSLRHLKRIRTRRLPRIAADSPGTTSVMASADRGHALATAAAKWANQRHIGFRRQLARIQPGDFDVVHLHATYPGCAALASLSRLATTLPVVWTLHDTWAVTGGVLHDLSDTMSATDVHTMLTRGGQPQRARLYHQDFLPADERDFIQRWMPRPIVAVAPSHYLADRARSSELLQGVDVRQIANPTVLLDHPVSEQPRVQARLRLGLAADRPVVLMIAADLNVAHKGLMQGLQALNGLADPLPQLLLLGNTPPSLMGTCSYRGPIQTTSALDSETLGTAYRAADVTLIPSLTENLPYTALESLACRTPIAAFAVGGLREIVTRRRGGLLARPFQVSDLSDCLAQLINDAALRQRLAVSGQEWVARHCRMADHISRMRAVYATAIRLHTAAARGPSGASPAQRAA